MWSIGWAPNNASKWQMGFNSALKGLKYCITTWLWALTNSWIYSLYRTHAVGWWSVLQAGSCGFISGWDHLNFSLTQSFRLHYVPGVDSDSFGSTRWRSWLKNCATTRKIAGSIPDGVVWIFNWHNPSSRNMAYKRNEDLEYFLGGRGGKGDRYVGLTTLQPSCADCLEILEPRTPGIFRASPGLYWDYFTF